MNHKRLISLTTSFILSVVPGLSVLSFASNESETNTEAEQHFEKAYELRKATDYDAAIVEYEKVISLSPNSKITQNAQYWIGQSYFEAKQFDAALSAFQALLDKYPTSSIAPSTKQMIERVQQAKKNRALFEAVKKAHVEQVRLLITQGADVDAKWGDTHPTDTHTRYKENIADDTPLLYAVDANNMDLVELLVEADADVNAGTWPPLVQAVEENNMAIAEYLIDHGADLNYPPDWGSLLEAVHIGNIEMIKFLIEKGADVNATEYTTPLLEAIQRNRKVDKDIVKLLIQHGADVNNKAELETSPLDYAIFLDNSYFTKILLANGAEVNAKDKYGRTPLYIANQQGHAEIVDLLRKYGANESLHYAAGAGDIEKVRELIAQHADVNQRDENGQTPLHRAVPMGHIDVAELLLNKGANINAKTQSDETGYTSLQLAADRGQLDMVKLLVAKGADVNTKRQKEGHKDRTAKSYALGRNYKEIVEFLYAHGADIPKIHLAAYRGHLETVKSLIEGGTEVDAKDDDGTPLHYAAMAGHEAIARFLIDATANVNARNRNGWTPLHFAAIGGSAEVARMLVARGADIEARSDNGQTPLLRAAAEGSKGVIEVLLDNGAGVNIADPTYGWTPLHYAARYGHRDVVELLLDKKASIEVRLTTGHTPLALAEQVGHTAIAGLLRKHGAKEE